MAEDNSTGGNAGSGNTGWGETPGSENNNDSGMHPQ